MKEKKMEEEQKQKVEFFECSCHSNEHTLQFILDPGNKIEPPEMYASIFLNQYRNIFKRAWIAFKYVFGYKCKYGHWDCFLMKNKDATRMINLLKEYKTLAACESLKYKYSN